MLSGAPRRFLNFILEAEIWAYLGVFEGLDRGKKLIVFCLYLGSKKKNRLGAPESIQMRVLPPNLAQGFGL